MNEQRIASSLVRFAAGFALAGAALLTGCQSMVTTAPTGLTGNAATITGVVHGGQFPVSGATVQIYTTGTGGYGLGSTLKATYTADSSGNFAFTKHSMNGGTESNTGSAWSCPASGNPIVYITATGGISTGSTTNPSIEMMAVLGPCSSVSTNTVVTINELTTVAGVFALAQYINPGTTPGTFTIGTSSSAQGTVGINNAAANVANLVNVSIGQTVAYTTYNGTGSAAGTYVTATPETAKIVTIANILAACINSANTSSTAPTTTACADLFANALKPTSASVTSQPSATFGTAQDTLQAAYYMATNPAEINGTTGAYATPPSCASNPNATTALNCLFGLASATSPFQTGLSAAPTDWTIGVTLAGSLGTATCANSSYLMAEPYKGAIDANGNLWFINGGSSVSNLVELSPLGQPLACLGQLSNGRGVTIDSAGNVWASWNGVAGTGNSTASGLQEVTATSIASGTPTLTLWPTPSGQNTYTMTADGAGNVFYNNTASGGSVWEIAGAATATPTSSVTPVQITPSAFNGTTNTVLMYTQVDPSGRIWDSASSSEADVIESYPSVTAPITAYKVTAGTPNTVTFTAANSFAIGNMVTVSGLSTLDPATTGVSLNGTYTLTAATASSFTATTTAAAIGTTTDTGTATPTAGSYSFDVISSNDNAYGMAIDSSNAVYEGTTCCSTSNDLKLIKYTPSATGAGATKSLSAQLLGGFNGVRSVAVDGASNVWVGSEYPNYSNGSAATATNGYYSIAEISTSGSGTGVTFKNLSPPTLSTISYAAGTCTSTVGCPTGGGYEKNSFLEPYDMDVDPSGNLWVLNSLTATGNNGTGITQVIGAAVPVVTPLSTAVGSGTLNTKP